MSEPTANLEAILRRVQKLIALADDFDNPKSTAFNPVEAATYRAKADALMLQYAIDEIAVDAAKPATERAKPGISEYLMGDNDEFTSDYLARLIGELAHHCRVKATLYSRYDREDGYYGKVYGYESDRGYFTLLYTTVRLHMLGALRPTVNPELSDDENAYVLHNAGYNWLEIAKLYGWSKVTSSYRVEDAHEAGKIDAKLMAAYDQGKSEVWYHAATDAFKSNWQLGSGYKRACQREGARRGEDGHVRIAAGGTDTYRRSAAEGYVNTINRRLRAMRSGRTAGHELELAGRTDDLNEFYRASNPHSYEPCRLCGKHTYKNALRCDRCGEQLRAKTPEEEAYGQPCPKCEKAKSGQCRDHAYRAYKTAPTDSRAYQAGVAHANAADLMGNRMGSAPTKPIEG